MARKIDPNTKYKIYIHTDKKYRYAAVQMPVYDERSGKIRNKIVHYGTVSEDLVFTPNAIYKLTPLSERLKLIFPKGWNLSKIEAVNDPQSDSKTPYASSTIVTSTKIDSEDRNSPKKSDPAQSPIKNEKAIDSYTKTPFNSSINNRLYGSFWLLEKIAEKVGLKDNLMTVFEQNVFVVNELLSLAFYPYISGKNYNRFAKWQQNYKTLLDYKLDARAIVRLIQQVTYDQWSALIKLRIKRLSQAHDSNSKINGCSSCGKCLCQIYWVKNKTCCNCMNAVLVVYAAATHEIVYYSVFTVKSQERSTTVMSDILAELNAIGIKDVEFTTDGSLIGIDNYVKDFVVSKIPFMMRTDVESERVAPLLFEIEYDEEGMPVNMQYDAKRRLYIKQVAIPAYTGRHSDGTQIEIDGLTCNLFLNMHLRTEELGRLNLKIAEEKNILKKATAESYVPDNISEYSERFEYFDVFLVKDGNLQTIKIGYKPNSLKISQKKSQCGFFSSVMYKQEADGITALKHYKFYDENKENIELLENQMSIDVLHNQDEDDSNCGHSLIALTGLITISAISNIWKTAAMRDKYQSALDLLDEMETIRALEYTDGSALMTPFTTRQAEISRACGIEPPYECLPSALK